MEDLMHRRINGKIAVLISGPVRYVTFVNRRLQTVLRDCDYDCFYHLWSADLGNKVRAGAHCDYTELNGHPRTKVLIVQSPYSQEAFAGAIGLETGSNSTINATMGMFFSVSLLCNYLKHLPDFESYRYALRVRTDCAILNDDFLSLLDPDPNVVTISKSYFIPDELLSDHVCFGSVDNFLKLWCYPGMNQIYEAYKAGDRNPEVTLTRRYQRNLAGVPLNPSIIRFRDYHIVYYPTRDCDPECINRAINNAGVEHFFLNGSAQIHLTEIDEFNALFKAKWSRPRVLKQDEKAARLIRSDPDPAPPPIRIGDGPTFSFVMIVLNGMPFIEYSLKSIYEFAHEVIIVEGAVEECMFAANPDGSSTDGTVEFIKSFPDPQRKIKLIQGRWPEKCEMQNEALRHVTGDYVWLIDSDEVYKKDDLDKVRVLIQTDSSITQLNFIGDNFWKGLDYIFVSSKFFETSAHWRRVFKFVKGANFTTHRPPTMVWPGSDRTTEQMYLLDGAMTRQMGIVPYHYSYVLDEQVRQKIELYHRYGWGKDWNIDLLEWYNECFLKWTPENRHAIEQQYPVWTGDRNSRTQLFTGIHPEVMKSFRDKLALGERWPERTHKRVRVAADYVRTGTQVAPESSFGAEIRELFAKIRPRKVIETGTYHGLGTTTIIADALEALGIRDAVFYTIEVNPENYARAKGYFAAKNMNVQALHGLSVPRSMLPDREEIARRTITDVDYDGIFVDHKEPSRVELYYGETDFPQVEDDLLYKCLERFDFRPDFVLLDSAGHIGSIEFDYLVENLRGECYIALDDICHVKHHHSFERIQSDPRFELITASKEKFGFCITKFTPGHLRERADGSHTAGDSSSVKKVLIVRSDSIGDFVIFSGALSYYRRIYPNAEITIVVPDGVANLAEACPFVDEVITFDRGKMVSQPGYAAEFVRRLRNRRFSVTICPAFSRDKVSEFMAINSGSPERITSSGDSANLPADVIKANNVHYTKLIPMSEGIALETFRNEEFLKGLGIELDGPYRPTVWITQADNEAAEQLLQRRAIEEPIVVAPFAQRDIRNWPAENWAKLISMYPHVPVVICGLEEDKAAADTIIRLANHPNIHNLCGLTTVRHLAALIAKASLCMSTESAAAHLAAGVNRPHVVLVGGGHFGRFMPYSPRTLIVHSKMDCYNCNWRCRYGRDIRCITSISVDMVKRAVDEALEAAPSLSARRADAVAEPYEKDSTGESRFLVSAIVSTYNSEKLIRGCLEDLENQTIAHRLEIIIVNSGSLENEETIVREYQQKYDNIVYIKTEHREGIYAAWNRAINVARGTFLTNANTDDRHREDALEKMAEILLAHSDVALVYGDQICTDTANGTFANHHPVEMAARPEYSRDRLLLGCCVGSQPMWRKSLHAEFGCFDDTLTCAGDWDFWLRVSGKYTFRHIPEFLGLYYNNKEGIEHGRKIHSLYERYVVGRRYGNPYISVIPLYKSKDNPLVSVIMPAYDAAGHIAEAIESVLIQNYRNFELVVVDDGSTDGTKDIVSGFRDDKIRCLHQANAGPASARNLALKNCNGDFMSFLDADDMMTPDFLSRHLQEFDRHPQADLIYCDDLLVDENLRPIRVIRRPEYTESRSLVRDMFRCGFPVVPFRTCIRRSVFDRIGLFDEGLLVGEDYDMMRRFIQQGLNIHHLNNALYLRRMTADSLSRSHSSRKARCHFEVVKRFAATFAYDELFPDIPWHEIPAEMRSLHANCLAVMTYLAIAQDFVKSNSPGIYVKMAFEAACSQLNDCLRIDPDNREIRQLLHKCERGRQQYDHGMQQVVCHAR